ncbi:FAD/FMN-containing dehydrogenase [Micromonospora phaseoli]|uniref:FAD/FMN-containing dehydrogenase n=1 Tax=Micromonospora phaseoli TaxID=1144548 RepID=A0A1H7ANC1_9ACTN|nr:D-arabinono-1,4-lactone oxidase [Micromonospora phaseoli]PZV96446.1 FAD/FMN-containing dehydrogenase [Micromonospora phaseoli]GIJ76134.1 oxidoreductase [Micromonospora phaseoli]SEJ63572.1 FAD/FMN-containing dehydrogenase [Micromonospora phaseoli]
MSSPFVNWSGGLTFTPSGHAQPVDEDEVRELVLRARESGTTLRPVGSGHSSSPLVRTDGILVSLDRMAGVIDKAEERATVRGGTRLKALGEGLYEAGLAMDNLGDVDYQSIAGATATGTHGTGIGFGNLSTQVAEVRLVTGTGEVLDVSGTRNSDLLPAVRLSLGALGVVTQLTLDVQHRYDLRRRAWCAPVEWTLDHLAELQHTNRNADFYWYPRSNVTQIRTLNRADEGIGDRRWATRRVLESDPWNEPKELRTGPTHRTIPQNRELRFEEIEYMLPSEAFPACFAEVRRRILSRHRRTVGWRVLVRTVAADDIWLSNAYGRSTTTIACLQNTSLPHEEYFRDMEAVFRQYGGRPHWGKKHWLTARELRPLFPRWDDFQAVRRRLDPDGVFLSPDLARLLEEA